MAVCFFSVLALMWLIAIVKPLAQPVEFKTNTRLNLETSSGARLAGIGVVIVTLILYFNFSPFGVAK